MNTSKWLTRTVKSLKLNCKVYDKSTGNVGFIEVTIPDRAYTDKAKTAAINSALADNYTLLEVAGGEKRTQLYGMPVAKFMELAVPLNTPTTDEA